MTSRTAIVVGIDFGTTYSGVSWAVNAGEKIVRVISNWRNPRARNASEDKVPSAISYSDYGQQPSKWGYEVLETDESLQWMKLLLEPNEHYAKRDQHVDDSAELLRRLNKEVVNAVADYLHMLWDFAKADIRSRQGNAFQDFYDIRVVVTVPACWSPTAKRRTEDAARLAGLGDHIRIVPEPEAAAYAVLRGRALQNELRIGECFIVCDAGGGTVDLISYEVVSLEPLSIKECAVSKGGLCGSVFINDDFLSWIESRTGQETYHNMTAVSKKKVVQDFENQVKRGFDPDRQRQHALDLRGVPDDPTKGIVDGEITIPSSVVRNLFDKRKYDIQDLIKHQIDQMRTREGDIKAIFLVGGFGESAYLRDELDRSYRDQGIDVLQDARCWSAVCRGATIWGLEHAVPQVDHVPTILSRKSQYSYGIVCRAPFDAAEHDISDRIFYEPEGKYFADNQMEWLFQRGSEISLDQIYDHKFRHDLLERHFKGKTKTLKLRSTLFYSKAEDPPPRYERAIVKKLCTVEHIIKWNSVSSLPVHKSPSNGLKYRYYWHTLGVKLSNVQLDFEVTKKGNQLISHTVEYPET